MTKNYIAIFSNLTEQELRNRVGVSTISHSTNTSISIGDGMLFINKDMRHIFGVTRAIGPAYKPAFAQNVYSDQKYNKWEMPVQPIVYFANPISYEDLRELIGATAGYKTNIYKGFQNGFQEAFVSVAKDTPAPDSAEILRKLDTIVKMHI